MANTQLEQGLFLPIRFYTSITEKEKYKPLSQGVANNYSYVYVDSNRLIPFQIYIPYLYVIETVNITLHCVETGETTSLGDVASKCVGTYEFEVGLDRGVLIYKGDARGLGLATGLHYIDVNLSSPNGDIILYSDDFMISEIIPLAQEDLRVHSPSPESFRLIDATNLRITNT